MKNFGAATLVGFLALCASANAGTLSIGKHYTSSQGGDATHQVMGGAQDLSHIGWDNDMSRYKIDGDETWEFYDSNDFSGEPLFVAEGPLDWTRVESKYNDKVSSVKLSGTGTHFLTSTGDKNYLERDLVPGDVLTAWGIFATGTTKFNFNLMKENDEHFMIHVDFRPGSPSPGPYNENKVVLNSKKYNGWEQELRTALPTFVDGKEFKVEVRCLEDEFEIFVDGNVLGSRFPYRDGFSLSEVKFVWLLGGSNGMVWTDLALPLFDGVWGEWSAWGECSSPCVDIAGSQVRTRACKSPSVTGTGAPCAGEASETQSCNSDIVCPVDGYWGEWSAWSECSSPCESVEGSQEQTRACDNPPVAGAGAPCSGDDKQSQKCFSDGACPVSEDGLQWHPFSLPKQLTLLTDFSNMDMERFYVRFPCSDTIWFKLFLFRSDGQNSHVELFDRKKGNIYCNDAGDKKWYNGARTDFTISEDMQCEADGSNIILVVEKTDKRVTIKNRKKVLYNQEFTANDGNCGKATSIVKTQVWNYNKDLELAVFGNNIPVNLGTQDTCFVDNFDYDGADIVKVSNADSAESCLGLCAITTGCISIAFVQSNGDCWLKNLMYGQHPCPQAGVISANLVCQRPRLISSNCVKHDFDYWGADIKSVSGVATTHDCGMECRAEAGCKSIAFEASSGNCWLKYLENGARPEAKDGITSVAMSCINGVVSGNGVGNECLEVGIDFPGADIKSVQGIYTIEECTALCRVEEGCISLTHRASTLDCWLKNKPNGNGKAFLDTVNSINLNCFILQHVEEGCVKEDFDYRGADIKSISNVGSINDCISLCAGQAGCVSVTHQPSTSKCWLKNKRFGAEPQNMSGVSSRNLICGDLWCEHANSFLYTYATAPAYFDNLEDAMAACKDNDSCNGVTKEPYNNDRFTLRRGPTIHDWSPTAETSWTFC